jgi:hypothetical protein
VSYSYNVLYNAFKRLSHGYSPAERGALFHDIRGPVSYRQISPPGSTAAWAA